MQSFIMRAVRKLKNLIRGDQEMETGPTPLAVSYVPREDVQEQIAQRLDGEDITFRFSAYNSSSR